MAWELHVCGATVTGDRDKMYQTPTLEKFGKFRELTLQRPPGSKNVIGDDLVPGVGLDCSNTASPTDPRACRS